MASLMVALNRSKNGGYAARKVIPKDVRKEYRDLYGRACEEKLRIAPGVAPHEAKTQCAEWLAEIETRIGRLRAAKNGEGQPLTRRDAHSLAGRWYRWFIQQHESDLCTPSHWKAMGDHLVWNIIRPRAPDEYSNDSKADPEWEWKANPEVRTAVRPLVAELAKTASFLLEQGISLTVAANAAFLDVVEDNLIAAYARLEGLARGDYTPDPLVQQFPEYVKGASETKAGPTCWSLFEGWAKAVQPSSGTTSRWMSIFKAVHARFPDASQISVAEARTWMNELIDDRRSARTVGTVWRTALKTVFAWGVNEGAIMANPFKEVKISIPRKISERETKAFTTEEVRLILKASLTYGEPKSATERTRRWVPWVCAYTGARAGEITQLRTSDIQKRGNDYFARLSPSAGKMKTRTARTVPLHEHLIEQGFASFVENSGVGPLFYSERKKRDGKGSQTIKSPADQARDGLGAWVRSLGIVDREVSPNHAWRHTFKAQAARSDIAEVYSDAITGHAPPTVGRAYTAPTAEDLAKAIRKFPRYEV